jgi:putative oxidoreductase
MKIRKLLQLDFLPRSAHAGLLVLRLWLGSSLLLLHGWSKLTGFTEKADKFPDPIGIGPSASLALAIFAEVCCSVLMVVGLFTRAAAFVQVILMSVAFFIVHQARLAHGPNSGELALVYLGGFVTLLLAGPGRYSFDAMFEAKQTTE